MKQSDLSYLHTVSGIDEQFVSPEDMMDYTTEFDIMDRGEETEEQAAARREEAGKLAGGLTGAIADITPFVGTAKAATELPEDTGLIKDLIASGYTEGDLKKMGLGGGMALLTGLGFLPGVKLAADVGKRAIKEGVEEAADELGTQTRRAFGQEALISPQRQAQLDAAARLPASERRRFLKEVNRPDQLVFHGAGSLSESPELIKLENKIEKGISENINLRLQDITRKKDEQGKTIFDNAMKSDEFVKNSEFAGINIPIFDEAGEYSTMPVRLRKNKEGDIEIVQYNEETLQDEQVIDKLNESFVSGIDALDNSGGRLRIQIGNKLSEISKELSATPEAKSRKAKIRESGFDPFSEFQGAVGMAGKTRGAHAELSAQALSTSVDPGVSMKPAFAGTDPENIVYARLPREKVRDMTPEEYAQQTSSSGSLARDLPLGEGQVGYRLPKSIHLEDEIAVTRPEELDVKSLTDDPYMVNPETSLLDLVKDQQKEVKKLLNDIEFINSSNTGVPIHRIQDSAAAQRQAYDKVREILTQAEGLGKYARGQGTGDTYDNLMDDIMLNKFGDDESNFYRTIVTLAESLPKGSQRKTHMEGLVKVATALKDKPIQGARKMARQDLRNLPDNYLRDVVYKGMGDADEVDNLLADAGYRDLKRLMMIGTQNMNRGGLMTPR